MALTNDNRTLGEMFAELSREIRTLVRQEIQLAQDRADRKGVSGSVRVSASSLAVA